MIKYNTVEKILDRLLMKQGIKKAKRPAIIASELAICRNDSEAKELIKLHSNLARDYVSARKKSAIPSESSEQIAVVEWFRTRLNHAGIIFAIPNGGKRSATTAAILKREGVLRGVADLEICWHNGATTWVEMKRQRGGKQSIEQKEFQQLMESRGDIYLLCIGADDAKLKIWDAYETVTRTVKQ